MKIVEEIKTNFISNNLFLKMCSLYEIMWKNIVESDRPQMTVWHMYIACWITKATNTHTQNM